MKTAEVSGTRKLHVYELDAVSGGKAREEAAIEAYK